MAVALAAAAGAAHAECGEGMIAVVSPSGAEACASVRGADRLLERGWHAPLSISVHDTVVVASTADSIRPSDAVVARVLEGRDLAEQTRKLVYDSYAAATLAYEALTAAEEAWLAANPRINVAYEHAWPPLEYDDGGRIAGLSVSYIEAFEEFTGAEFVPVHAMTLTDGVNKIRSGEADMSFMSVDSDDKLDYMYFTDSHTALSANLITYGPRDIGIDDLESVRIGTVRGTEVEAWLDHRHRGTEYASLHDYELAFEQLRDGRIDVLIDSWIVVSHVAAASGFEGLHNAGPAGHVSEIAIGCTKSKLVLCRILDKALASIPGEERERMLLEAIADSAAHGGPAMTGETADAVHEAYLATKQTVAELVEEEKEWLAGRDEIRVAYEANWEPLEYVRRDGSLGGLTAMYADAFSEFAGIEFVPHGADSWTEALSDLADGRADVAFMIAETGDRRKYLGFTEPHTIISYSLITYGQSQLGPDDIGNVRVGTLRGYEIETWLDLHHPGTEYVSLHSYESAFEALRDGRIDALIEIWPVASHIAEETGFEGLYSAGTAGHTMDLSVGYTKTEPVLDGIVKKALESVPVQEREEMLVEALVRGHLSHLTE